MTYGAVALDNGYLMGAYGALAIRYNNLLLWGRCIKATHDGEVMPAACPQ